jgi:hypothetical protein
MGAPSESLPTDDQRIGTSAPPNFGTCRRKPALCVYRFIILRLLTIFATVLIGWLVRKPKWLGGCDVARTLSNATYYTFVPALLFRTTARIELGAMLWGTLAAVFVPW